MISRIVLFFKNIYKISDISRRLQILSKIGYVEHLESLKKQFENEKSLQRYSFKAFSQNDEDGIINEIFKRIGVTNKVFVEFGVGDGLESNSFNLLLNDWRGLWIEASRQSCIRIKNNLSNTILNGRLIIENSFITAENIDMLISKNLNQSEIDLLSVDIDGNDFHVLQKITCVNPRVIVIEYNAKLMPHIEWVISYDPSFVNTGDSYHGASLKFLEVHLSKMGYSLVGCCLAGVNAFFVRNDLLEDKFLEPYTAENHFIPARYYMSSQNTGHPSSYRILESKFL